MARLKQIRWVYYGWWIVIASLVMMFLSYGVRYSFGVYLKPVCDELGWGRATTSGAFSLYMGIYAIGALVLGILTDRYGPRIVCSVGALLIGAGLIMASFTSAVWHLYLSYGILTALGAGAMYVPTNATVAKFFKERRGLALGIASAGVGLGTFVMLPVSQHFISSFDWHMAFLLTGLIVIVIGIPVAAIVMRRSPEDMGLYPYGKRSEEARKEQSHPLEADYTLPQALGTPIFWIFFIAYALFDIPLMATISHLPALATDLGIAENMAAWAAGFVGLASIAGRIGLGAIGDRIGRRSILMIVALGLVIAMLSITRVGSPAVLWAWVAFYGFCYGGMAPNVVGLLADLFGPRAIATLLGALTIAAGIGGAIGPWLAGYIFDTTGSYDIAFLIFAGCALLAFVAVFFLRPSSRGRLGKAGKGF